MVVQPLGFGNAWSVSSWFRFRTLNPTPNTDAFHLWGVSSGEPPAGNNGIDLFWTNRIAPNNNLTLTVTDKLGSGSPGGLHSERYNNLLVEDTWYHLLVTWDGTTIKLYQDAVLKTSDLTVNLHGSPPTDMDDSTDRRIQWVTQENGGDAMDGFTSALCFWNVTLDQSNITEIFNGKLSLNLRKNVGNYTKAGNVQHYYRTSDLNGHGTLTDLGKASNLIVFPDSIGISDADVSTEVPT